MLRFSLLHPDWTVLGNLALPASLLLLSASLLLLTRALARQPHALRGELARIFEQLDLLRFDAQQALAPAAAAPLPASAAPAVAAATAADHGGSDYYAAAQLAAGGSSAADIAGRCGIVNGEARVLVALQQARARRAQRH